MISLTFLVGSVGRTFFFFVYDHLSYNYYETGLCSKGLIVYGLGYCLVRFSVLLMFNFCINNVVGKPIIKGLFYIKFKIVT